MTDYDPEAHERRSEPAPPGAEDTILRPPMDEGAEDAAGQRPGRPDQPVEGPPDDEKYTER